MHDERHRRRPDLSVLEQEQAAFGLDGVDDPGQRLLGFRRIPADQDAGIHETADILDRQMVDAFAEIALRQVERQNQAVRERRPALAIHMVDHLRRRQRRLANRERAARLAKSLRAFSNRMAMSR